MQKESTNKTNKFVEIVEKHKYEKYIFHLFINGTSILSAKTIQNALAIFEHHLKDRYELKVIDASKEKSFVIKEHIIAMPLLIKKFPFPEVRLVGDLSDTQKVTRDLLIQ